MSPDDRSRPAPGGSRPPGPSAPEAPDLAAKVRFLRDGASYGTPGSPVEAIETHMAWVFLVGAHAYKMKKPVIREMLDYRTLDDRLRVCSDEVRLNRRLAPHIYLGIVPLTWLPKAGFSVGGEGDIVDWLVHMRRLPRERMLDQVATRGRVGEEEVDGALDSSPSSTGRPPSSPPLRTNNATASEEASTIQLVSSRPRPLPCRRLS